MWILRSGYYICYVYRESRMLDVYTYNRYRFYRYYYYVIIYCLQNVDHPSIRLCTNVFLLNSWMLSIHWSPGCPSPRLTVDRTPAKSANSFMANIVRLNYYSGNWSNSFWPDLIYTARIVYSELTICKHYYFNCRDPRKIKFLIRNIRKER